MSHDDYGFQAAADFFLREMPENEEFRAIALRSLLSLAYHNGSQDMRDQTEALARGKPLPEKRFMREVN